MLSCKEELINETLEQFQLDALPDAKDDSKVLLQSN